MIIIGVDFHPEFQQIASVDTETGEFQEKRLAHREDAETFSGSNDCWPSCSSSCGLATRPRSRANEYANRRLIDKMHS